MSDEVDQEDENDPLGYFVLAKRDLERGGESLYITCKLPVRRSIISAQAYARDKQEIEANPNSDNRFFVDELSPQEIADYQAKNDET